MLTTEAHKVPYSVRTLTLTVASYTDRAVRRHWRINLPEMTASSVYVAPKKKLEISFGGCGFLGVYHVGVGKCVVDHAPHLFDEFSAFYGASAGAITAVCAACKSDPMVPYKWVKKTFEASRKYRLLGALHPSFDLYARLREFLEGFLPENAHKLCRKKVKISLTVFNEHKTLPEPQNWLVSNFTTRNELINAIIASSFIPGYAGLKDLPKFRGKRCCDGGFTSNIPCCHDDDVITVSPFSGECDICPQGESHSPHLLHIVDQSLQLSTKNIMRLLKALVPSSWSELEDLFYTGYKDAYRFFKLEGIVSEAVMRPVRRHSSLLHMASSANGATARSMTAVVTTATAATSKETKDDTSDYSSQCSEPFLSRGHSRRCSVTVSTNGDFFSCIDEEEEEEMKREIGEGEGEGGKGKAKVPSYLRSLWREMEQIVKELESAKRREAEEGQQPSSWPRLSWLVQMCSPTQLPIIRSIVGSRDNRDITTDDLGDCWETELSEHPGLLHSILSSWSSSMTVM